MKAVIQRVTSASVSIHNKEIARIRKGLLIFFGVAAGDNEEDARMIAEKISKLRIFADEKGKMNRSLVEINGAALVVSQFTLLADTKKGNRPSFAGAASPEKAKSLYELFIEELKRCGVGDIQRGEFGAYMQVSLVNDGPVTIVM